MRDLYQEVLLDHNKKPRNFGRPAAVNREASGHNPLCGDEVTVYLDVTGDVIIDVGFEGSGCAISTASASLLTEGVKGKSVAEALALFDAVTRMAKGIDPEPDPAQLGKLAVLAGVRDYPVRVKCATLAWHTLRAALEGQRVATTEL